MARVLEGSGPSLAHGRALFTLGLLEEYAGSVPYAVELLASAAERLDGEHRTRALTELALARFRLNDVAGIGECAARITGAADHNDPVQRMLSDFTRGLAVTLRGDSAAGQVLLRDVTEQISCPPLRDDPRSLLFLALTSGFLGDPRIAMSVGSYQLSQIRNRGALGVLVPALALFASGRAWLGDHARAFADAGEASELGNQLGYAADTAVAVEMLAWQSAARGFHQDAHAALERAKSLTDRAGTTSFAAHQALTAAFCALCRSDPAAAVSLLEARIAADGRRSLSRRGLRRARTTRRGSRCGRAVCGCHLTGGTTVAAGAGGTVSGPHRTRRPDHRGGVRGRPRRPCRRARYV